MSYISIILLAIALSIDASVVSFSYGITFTQKRLKNALSLAICTGLFQGIMPTIGYYLTGLYFKDSNDEQKHRGKAEYKDLPIFKK